MPFDHDFSKVVFEYADVDHSGSVDIWEFCGVLATFAAGTLERKAELVFRVIDKDNSGSLTKSEVQAHARMVLHSARSVVTRDIAREAGAVEFSGLVGMVSDQQINPLKRQFEEDIVRDVFSADADGDGVISLAEWLAAVRGNNNTVRALVEPVMAASAWKVLFGADDELKPDNPEAFLDACKTNPRGFCLVFDFIVSKIEPPAPIEPPTAFSIRLVGRMFVGGGSVHHLFEQPLATWQDLIVVFQRNSGNLDPNRCAFYKGARGDRLRPSGPQQQLRQMDIHDGDDILVVDSGEPWQGAVVLHLLSDGRKIPLDGVASQLSIGDFQGIVEAATGIDRYKMKLR